MTGTEAADPVVESPALLRFGPAGWSYRDWAGIVYPAAGVRSIQPIPLLAGLFDTIEVNVTFYRDIPTAQFQKWCRQVEPFPAFQWCFKLHQRFSHAGRVPPVSEISGALTSYAPVREAGRLGALLLQFPWSLRRTRTNHERIRALLDHARGQGWPLVVELRHVGWGDPPPGFPPVICDQPSLPENLGCDAALSAALSAAEAGAGPLYIRLHGRNRASWFAPEGGRDERYNYLYRPQERQQWLTRLQHIARQTAAESPVFLIANNHYRGQAVVDALLLQELWRDRRPPLPPSLKRAYPRQLGHFPEIKALAADPPTERDGSGPPTLF